ncbi:MAG: hypothetical protein ABI675_01060 [Chitinophagaceae bacterium]
MAKENKPHSRPEKLGKRIGRILSIDDIMEKLERILRNLSSRNPTPLMRYAKLLTIALKNDFKKSVSFKIAVRSIGNNDGKSLVKELSQPGIKIRMHVMYRDLSKLIPLITRISISVYKDSEELAMLKQEVIERLRYLELLIAERYNEI